MHQRTKKPRTIAIVGMGYVGLPLALRFADCGLHVWGLDTDAEKVDQLNCGLSYIRHLPSSRIRTLIDNGSFAATTDFSKVREVEAVLLCVPTPLNANREPDLSYVLNSGRAVAPYLRGSDEINDNETSPKKSDLAALNERDDPPQNVQKKLVVLESTTYPGTTETDLRRVLEEGSGLQAGVGFHLAYSPEREDPGRTDHSVQTIPKIIGGYTASCLQRCEELYRIAMDQLCPVSSCRVAEAAKLTENIFRSVNIALVNELKMVYHKMDINVWEVIEAAATKPFGYMPFYPGPGLGGHCIPIDPFYLTWKAREYEQNTRFIELAGEINTTMPDYVLTIAMEALNDEGKAIRDARILLLGIAYKPNVDDDRESPGYVLWKKLEKKGAIVTYNDPYVPVIRPTRKYPELTGIKSVDIADTFDLIILVTHHDEYRQIDFSGYQCPIVDTRNCIKSKPVRYYQA